MTQTIIPEENYYPKLDSWIEQTGAKKIMLVCDESIRFLKDIFIYFERIESRGVKLIRFRNLQPNPHYESVVAGVQAFLQNDCSAIIALGRGSTIDAAKCIKLFSNLDHGRNYLEQVIVPNRIPFLSILTDIGTGRETTRYADIYYNDIKHSISNESITPDVVLLEPGILKTWSLYKKKSIMMDAFCNALESFWSINSTKESRQFSKQAIELILQNMDSFFANTDAGNVGMLLAANTAFKAINITQTTAGYAMCDQIAKLFGCAHGHAAALCDRVLFPWMHTHTHLCVDSRGEDFLKDVFNQIANAMGCDTPEEAAHKLDEIFTNLGFEIPSATEEQFAILKSSVNPAGLKNHPIKLDLETIDSLYRSILSAKTQVSLYEEYDFSTYENDLLLKDSLIEEMSSLYSHHYGVWSNNNPHSQKGQIKLSSNRIRNDFIDSMSCIVTARKKESKELIGYAIGKKTIWKNKKISWITQFVVHKEYRNKRIGQVLLYSLWCESDIDAWGIVTSNPYAIRALEIATHRRCSLKEIIKNKEWLFDFGRRYISYISDKTELSVSDDGSRINTDFYVDHTSHPEKISNVTKENIPWIFGLLPDGWEWFAFTFKTQVLFPLSPEEIQNMLDTCDQNTKQAYARMDIASHSWAKHHEKEIEFILSNITIPEHAKVLDLGSGNCRHSILLAKRGYQTTAVDYNSYNRFQDRIDNFRFIKRDILDLKKESLEKDYDLVLCLYDVIGTYAEEEKNNKIIKEIYDHLTPGGYAVISVLNMDYTLAKNPQVMDLKENMNALLSLPSEKDMQNNGEIFNPEKLIVDKNTNVCYRKEQFDGSQDGLFAEYIVRDRRYKMDEICYILKNEGFNIIDSRYVKAGKWNLHYEKHEGKEILLICQKEQMFISPDLL